MQLLDKSAIILAGGFSSRLGKDKALLQLASKPLIRHVLDSISNVVEEKLVIVSSKTQVENYSKIIGSKATICMDKGDVQSPLAGVLAGFEKACGEYSLVLPCDAPFLNKDILLLLFDLCIGKAAAIPRWPNRYMEPLHAVYRTESALEATRNALAEGRLTMQSMVDKLRGVRYISTLVLQQLDPELRTFSNINTFLDLKKAENLLKRINK